MKREAVWIHGGKGKREKEREIKIQRELKRDRKGEK